VTITDSIAIVKEKQKGPARKISGPFKFLVAAAAVEAASAVETAPSSEITASVEVAAAIAAIESTSIPAATVVAISTTVVTATIVAAPVAVSMIAVVAVIPRAGADEDADDEPIRSVVAVGRASVWVVVVVAVGADGRRAIVIRGADSDAHNNALGVRGRCGEEANSETNAE
jgi:hypothetical protein